MVPSRSFASDDALVDRIYRRLNGGNFGTTSKDCIRAVLHAFDGDTGHAPPEPQEPIWEDFKTCDECGVLYDESYCPRCEEMGGNV